MHSPRTLKRMGIVTALMLRFTALGLTVALVPVPVGADAEVPIPPPFSRTLALPDPTARICMPRLMLSSESGVTDWFAKADGTSMTVSLITQSVNPAERGQVQIEIFQPGNSIPIVTRVQDMPTGGQADIEQSDTFPTTAGAVYRVRLTLIPPAFGPVAHHYQLQFPGAVQIGQNSPTTPSFEPVGGGRRPPSGL